MSRNRVAIWVLPALLPSLAFLLLYARTLDYDFVWTDGTALGAFAGTAGHLDCIVAAELACRNELALGRYRRILEIE